MSEDEPEENAAEEEADERTLDDEFVASEATLPDLGVGLDLTELEAARKAFVALTADPAESNAAGEDEDPEAEQDDAPGSAIPAPRLGSGPKSGARAEASGWQPDGLAIAAIVVFVLVGAVLVFNFARALVPAAEAQLGAACRPLRPDPKTGPAPALELEDLEGNPVSLADYQGKFLVVNFWATWCEPCTREWPDLDTLAHRMSERDDVAVLAISVDQELGDIGPYLERMGLGSTPVEILRAKDPAAHQTFGSEKIPDTYFVDEAGQFEAVFVNVREWGRAKAVRCVEASAR